ncbi:MAG: HAD family hydrolase, partial [Oscillospiraceae bacterium]
MAGRFDLIAFDVDGTLLDSEKNLRPEVAEAVKRASDSRVEVVLSTGRSVAELRPVVSGLPGVRYAVCTSGSFIYDFKEETALASFPMQRDIVRRIVDASRLEDTMLQMMSRGRSVVTGDLIEHMADYGMARYQKLYRKVCLRVPDVREYILESGEPAEKINMYHRDAPARDRNFERVRDLRAEMVYSELTS